MDSQRPSWGARGVFVTIVRGWVVVVGVAIAYGLVALAYSWWSTPLYQASATLYVTSGSGSAAGGSSFDAVRASQERAATYGKLLYSDAVISPAITSAGLDMPTSDVKENLQVDIDPAVMTMTISATDSDPLVAQRLANAISDSLADAVSTLDVPSGGGTPAARLTVVNTAAVDPDPTWPKMYMNIGIAAGVGLLVGIGLVLLLERTNNRVRDESDAEIGFGARVLATLPKAEGVDSVIDFDTDRGKVAAAYRTLRTGFAAVARDSSIDVLAVTSPRAAGSSASAVAVNLAGALAHTGNSVVVVDTNFADPQISRALGSQAGNGITDVLAGRVQLDAAVTSCGAQYGVLGVGSKLSGDASDLLASKAFGALLNDLSAMFDYIVLDTPPILDSIEAVACAAWAEGALVVVPSKSHLDELRSVRRQLDDLGIQPLGLVLSPQGGASELQPSGSRSGGRDGHARPADDRPNAQETTTRLSSGSRA